MPSEKRLFCVLYCPHPLSHFTARRRGRYPHTSRGLAKTKTAVIRSSILITGTNGAVRTLLRVLVCVYISCCCCPALLTERSAHSYWRSCFWRSALNFARWCQRVQAQNSLVISPFPYMVASTPESRPRKRADEQKGACLDYVSTYAYIGCAASEVRRARWSEPETGDAETPTRPTCQAYSTAGQHSRRLIPAAARYQKHDLEHYFGRVRYIGFAAAMCRLCTLSMQQIPALKAACWHRRSVHAAVKQRRLE